MKLRNAGVFVLMPLLFISILSCSSNRDYKGVELTLRILPPSLSDFLYMKMTYEFKVTDKFAGLDDDYKIFVHLWRLKNREMLLQDDHSPVKPFSQWKAGESITYSRMVFIPKFLDEYDEDFDGFEEIRLTAGLYKSTAGKNESHRILYRKVFNVESSAVNAPDLVYDEGWNQPEYDSKITDPDEQSWRWTKKKAVCIVQNIHKDALLIIRGGVDKTKIADQKVIFKINDRVLEEFIPVGSKFSKEYVIAADLMGTRDEFALTLETDKTFIPSGLDPSCTDDRELGIQIYFLYFRENTR